MSQRVDQRDPTKVELLAYDKALKLTDHILSVCKPKEQNVNTKHIPKRNVGLGRQLMDAAVEMGADILEANSIYVGANLPYNDRLANYKRRIALQENAKRLTFRIEHIFRVLHFDRPFADSTTTYMMALVTETRDVIAAWRDSEVQTAKRLKEQK